MTKIIKILLYSLALTPIVIDNQSLSAFSLGENLFVYGVLSIVSILFFFNFFRDANFRENVLIKVNKYYKNPLFISIFAFILSVLLSTIFAVDKYRAFWGDIERSEGFIGIFCGAIIFVFALIVWEKRGWLNFFKLSLFTSIVLLGKEFIQLFGGIQRPGSLLGNPTFLAGYLLFSIFCSIILFKEKGNKIWKYFSAATLILSFLGIFITQTRGTILGLFIGIVFSLIFCIVKRNDIDYKMVNLRKVSKIILCSVFVIFFLFIFTKNNDIWQKIPGISRFTQINSSDTSTQVRLLTSKIGLEAINPVNNGLGKLVLGWGQDNYTLASAKYFNPRLFNYEMSSYDRSHNKIIDVLVMNGVLGLISYLLIYFFFFFYVLKKKSFSFASLALIFFGCAYFTHLLFIFDQVTTYISFFIILSFTVYITSNNLIIFNEEEKIQKYKCITVGSFLVIVSLFFNYIFFTNILPGYIQMHKFNSFLHKGDINLILNKADSIFRPYTTVQSNLRMGLLVFTQNNYINNDRNINELTRMSLEKEEEYIKKESFDLKSMAFLATVYSNIGRSSNNIEYIKKGEEYFKKLISFSPNRPDYDYGLALNLFFQNRIDESFFYFEKAFNSSDDFFIKNKEKNEYIYYNFIQYFYKEKNKNDFIKTVQRLKGSNYSGYHILNQIIDYINKYQDWPKINFPQSAL